MFKNTEERLADQARAIRRNAWLTDVEIEELRWKVFNESSRCDDADTSEEPEDRIWDGNC